ncbi:MAG: helix-turn-helix domain-containing protein [Acidimicrobiales bacterium]
MDEAFLIAQHAEYPIFKTSYGRRYSVIDPEPPEPSMRNAIVDRIESPKGEPQPSDDGSLDDVAQKLGIKTARSVPKKLRPGNRLTLSVEEAAEALGISRALAYEAVRRGEIPNIRIGRRILVPRSALDRLLAGSENAR